MSARAIWQGILSIGSTKLPVKLYSAVVDRAVSFHLLHKSDQVQLEQRMVLPTGEPVENDQVRKGFLVDNETVVLLDKAELDRLAPAASRQIELTRFIPRQALPLEWLDRPYFLGPGPGQESDLAAFTKALGKLDRCGIARWVMRKRSYAGALCPDAGRLLLITLHDPAEVVPASRLTPPTGRDLVAEERELAERLVDALSGSFDPTEYEDMYHGQVRKLVEAKQKGRTLRARPRKAIRPATKSLADALRRSVQAAAR